MVDVRVVLELMVLIYGAEWMSVPVRKEEQRRWYVVGWERVGPRNNAGHRARSGPRFAFTVNNALAFIVWEAFMHQPSS